MLRSRLKWLGEGGGAHARVQVRREARTRLARLRRAALVLLVALAVRWLALDTGLLAPSLGPASALRLGDALC